MPKGKVAFKRFAAVNSTCDPTSLPYREPLLDYLRSERRVDVG